MKVCVQERKECVFSHICDACTGCQSACELASVFIQTAATLLCKRVKTSVCELKGDY